MNVHPRRVVLTRQIKRFRARHLYPFIDKYLPPVLLHEKTERFDRGDTKLRQLRDEISKIKVTAIMPAWKDGKHHPSDARRCEW